MRRAEIEMQRDAFITA
jgi:hypothetical protein